MMAKKMEDMDQDAIGDNTNNILCKDFFEPPPGKVGKAEMAGKLPRATGAGRIGHEELTELI